MVVMLYGARTVYILHISAEWSTRTALIAIKIAPAPRTSAEWVSQEDSHIVWPSVAARGSSSALPIKITPAWERVVTSFGPLVAKRARTALSSASSPSKVIKWVKIYNPGCSLTLRDRTGIYLPTCTTYQKLRHKCGPRDSNPRSRHFDRNRSANFPRFVPGPTNRTKSPRILKKFPPLLNTAFAVAFIALFGALVILISVREVMWVPASRPGALTLNLSLGWTLRLSVKPYFLYGQEADAPQLHSSTVQHKGVRAGQAGTGGRSMLGLQIGMLVVVGKIIKYKLMASLGRSLGGLCATNQKKLQNIKETLTMSGDYPHLAEPQKMAFLPLSQFCSPYLETYTNMLE
ncbi:hypothetical protein B0H12DRAFT_1073697 [Mycena haematopus]|nr:hypothetical protein B0H12DRAFT_1073697 [Mycena haematopus]